jgi:hypothetical protein
MGQASPCFCKGCKACHKSWNLIHGNNAIFIIARMRIMDGGSNFKTETLPDGDAGKLESRGTVYDK